jgi:hypothetical protein
MENNGWHRTVATRGMDRLDDVIYAARLVGVAVERVRQILEDLRSLGKFESTLRNFSM